MTMDTMMAVSLPPSCSVAMVWLKFPTWICRGGRRGYSSLTYAWAPLLTSCMSRASHLTSLSLRCHISNR